MITLTARPTAQSAVLERLREDIADRTLAPGTQLRQERLAERYGVSRVPIREALKVLEAEGQVVHHPHRGYFVAELSVAELVEVYRLRELLEAEAIRAAVPLLSDADLDGIEELLERVEAAQADLGALTAANRRFHFAIFEASDRPRLVRILHQLWDATEAYRALYFQQAASRERIALEHRALMQALRARDAELAAGIQDEHRRNSAGAVSALLTNGRGT